MLISVHQSTNKEKKTTDPHSGPPMPPRSLVVTRDTADRNATQYEDLPWGMQHDSESTHAHDGFALPHDTYLTLESGPYNVQFHTGPQSWHLVPSTPLSQCVHLQHLHIPELLPRVGVGWKAVPGPGARFAAAHCVIAAFYLWGRLPDPSPASSPSCCSGPALHPCRYLSGWHSDDHGVMCTEWQYG